MRCWRGVVVLDAAGSPVPAALRQLSLFHALDPTGRASCGILMVEGLSRQFETQRDDVALAFCWSHVRMWRNRAIIIRDCDHRSLVSLRPAFSACPLPIVATFRYLRRGSAKNGLSGSRVWLS